MTNERIAKVMGWEVIKVNDGGSEFRDRGFVDVFRVNKDNPDEDICVPYFSPQTNPGHAKLLQAKMVDGGWFIGVEECPNHDTLHHRFHAIAGKLKKQSDKKPHWKYQSYANTESQAIVALFEKIYGGEHG